MLLITIPGMEYWDEKREEFVYTKTQKLQLEHSLVSISKWESKWHKPFLHTQNKTIEETIDYIKCMTITQNVDPEVYARLTNKNMEEINAYIDNPMTATTITEENNGKKNRDIITAEIIDYWMISLNIPTEYRKWHLNKLITLIRVCNIKNAPPKKRGMRSIANSYREMNEARKKKMNTKG